MGMDNQMKLFFSAFVVVILGVVLIRPIADDITSVSTSSVTILNETLAFTSVTTNVFAEVHNMTNGSGDNYNTTTTLTFDDLTVITAIRNVTGEDVFSYCNVTLLSGLVICNHTGYPTNLSFDYTHIVGRTETLANDELISLDALRNITSENILGFCNVTLASGSLNCNDTYSSTGYADYAYTPDTYVRSSAARTLLTLTILFFALLILAVGLGYAMKSFKEGGLM